jgi:hypothetical protein
MINFSDIGEGEEIAAKFPGPITLVPSRGKWWTYGVLNGFVTIMSIILILHGLVVAMFLTAVFGIATMISVIALIPGSMSLQLNEKGFGVTKFFRTQIFHWSDVSDFGVCTFRGYQMIVFNAAKARLGIWDKMNAALAGKNGYLPDTFGLGAADLANLMARWRERALA